MHFNRKNRFHYSLIISAFCLLLINACGGGNKEESVSVTVPDVVGLHQSVAISNIIDVKLTVGSTSIENSETVVGGHVIRQTPASGISVTEGSPINLVISLGPVTDNDTDGIETSLKLMQPTMVMAIMMALRTVNKQMSPLSQIRPMVSM